MAGEAAAERHPEWAVSLWLTVEAPDYDAALRICTDAVGSVKRTNYRIRDGKVTQASTASIERVGDDDGPC